MVCGQLSEITDHKLGHKENGNIQRVFLQVRSKDSHVKTQTNKQTNSFVLPTRHHTPTDDI